MLWVDCVDPSGFRVSMLRGMDDGVLDPELFDAIDDDACPDLAEGLNKGEGTYVVDGDVLKNFGERAEFAPLP